MRKPPVADCYDYVRRTYGVPAYIGMRVTVHGKPGVLVPAKSDFNYIHVLCDDSTHSVPAHPTDLVEYHVTGRDEVRA